MQEIHTRLSDRQAIEFQRRFTILFWLIVCALSLIIMRLVYLQIIKGDDYRQKSENNSLRLRSLPPLRGLIMDRNHLMFAENMPSFDIYFTPNRIQNAESALGKVKKLYADNGISLSDYVEPALKSRSYNPIRIGRNADWKKIALLETNMLDLPGISVEVSPIRHYRDGELISHVVGYTGEITEKELEKEDDGDYDPGDIVGKYGIERYLDSTLRGKKGAEHIEVNVRGKKVKTIGRKEPQPGCNVVLTLDSRLQKIAGEAVNGRRGAVVVMDVRDGSILSLVSSPFFDINLFNGGISFDDWEKLSTDPAHPMENRAISGQYPPGSTYKLVVAAAALEEGLITPDKKVFCNGTYELSGRTYRCWQKEGHGSVNLHRAIAESCDVYFYTLGKMLGVDKIAWYARQFGFGDLTGVDLPREKKGLVPTKEWKRRRFGESWQIGETLSIAIGQGFDLVTPLQLASAYAALANGGILYRPFIVKAIQTPQGEILREYGPQKRHQLPLSKENLALLNYGLWGAVNEPGGTGYMLKRKEEDFCGKTGTAQVIGLPEEEKARRATRVSAQNSDHALFVCFGPYKAPEIVVAVILENAGHGGSAAAPVARKIVDAYFSLEKQGTEGAIAAQ